MIDDQNLMRTSARRHWPLIFLSTLILLHVVSHLVWLALDDRQVNWDPGWHLNNSLSAWEILTSPSTDILQRLSLKTHPFEPPLIYLLTAIPYALFGISADTANYINIFFLCILILATYGIGKDLYDQTTGLVAACLVSCYPLVVGYVRIYYLDIGLATAVTVSILSLIKTRHFTNRRASLLFGLALAAGLLTKKAYVIFMFTPMLLVIGRSFFVNRISGEANGTGKMRWQQLLNMSMAFVIGALPSAGWYAGRLQSILAQADSVEQKGASIGYGLSRWMHYPSFLDDVLSTSAILLLLVGIAIGLWHRDKRLCIPLTWLVGGLTLHSLIQLGHPRYLLPLVPSIAVLSSWWLLVLRPVSLRKAMLAAVILMSLINCSVFSWYGPVGQGPRSDESYESFVRPFPRESNLICQQRFWLGPKAFMHAYPPRKIGWPYEEIMDTIRVDAQEGAKRSLKLVLGADLSGFNHIYASYYSHLQAVKHSYQSRIKVYYYSAHWQTKDIPRLFDQPYILTKSGRTTSAKRFRHYIEGFKEILTIIRKTVPDRFKVVREFDMPDGSKATLYRRNGPVLSDMLADFDSDIPSQEEVETQLELNRKLSLMVGPNHELVRRRYIELARLLVKHGQSERAIRSYARALQSCKQCPGLSYGISAACRELEIPGGSNEKENIDGRNSSLHSICRDARKTVEGGTEEIKQTYHFLPNLFQATIVAPGERHVGSSALRVAGESRRVLWQHPDSEVTFRGLGIGSAVTLDFGVGIGEKAWDREGDGVLFEIIVSDGETVQTVYSRYIDPKSRTGDRRWFDETVDLQPFADSVISITFRTSSGPEDNQVCDWAGWSEPKLLPGSMAETDQPG